MIAKKYIKSFVFYSQLTNKDCGPTCLRMVARYYGRHYSGTSLSKASELGEDGVSLLALCETAEKLGFKTQAAKIGFQQLLSAPLPAILHWNQNHFVVALSIDPTAVKVANPSSGILYYTKDEFEGHWLSDLQERTGKVLFLEPTPVFYNRSGENDNAGR